MLTREIVYFFVRECEGVGHMCATQDWMSVLEHHWLALITDSETPAAADSTVHERGEINAARPLDLHIHTLILTNNTHPPNLIPDRSWITLMTLKWLNYYWDNKGLMRFSYFDLALYMSKKLFKDLALCILQYFLWCLRLWLVVCGWE